MGSTKDPCVRATSFGLARRRVIARGAIALGGFAWPLARPSLAFPRGAREGARPGLGNLPDSIHWELDFKASAERIYLTLLDSKKFRAMWNDSPAEIDPQVGGAFSIFGGHIVGRIVDLVPNRRIVQAWRVVGWAEGDYSIVHFELKPQASGTRMVFDHRGFPDGLKEHLADGWQEHYWEPLRKLS